MGESAPVVGLMSRNYAESQGVVDGLLAWLATPQQRSLRRAFGIWLRRVFLRRRLRAR